MSSKATAWAWSQPVTGLTKLVLLTLADVANQESKTWYTRKHLAVRATVSLATLARALNDLQDQGLLDIHHQHRGDGSLSSSMYTLMLGGGYENLGSITQIPGDSHETQHESNSESNSEPTDLKISATKVGPDFAKLIAEFSHTMNETTVREHIADSLAHINAKKWTDKTRYCRNWLKRAAERPTNGTPKPYPTDAGFTRGAGSTSALSAEAAAERAQRLARY